MSSSLADARTHREADPAVLAKALTEAISRLGVDADRYPLEDRTPMQQDIITVLKSQERLRAALKAVRDLDTRTHHDGYDNGPGGGNYIYRDVIFTDEAFPIIDRALAATEANQ